MTTHLMSAALVLALAACGGTPPPSSIARRASVDLECDPDQVRVHRLFGKTFETEGCGRRAVLVCNSRHCRRDSEVTAATERAAAAERGEAAGPAGVVRGALDSVRRELEACVSAPMTLVVEVRDGRFVAVDAVDGISAETRSCFARVLLRLSLPLNLSASRVEYPVGGATGSDQGEP